LEQDATKVFGFGQRPKPCASGDLLKTQSLQAREKERFVAKNRVSRARPKRLNEPRAENEHLSG